MTKRLTFDFEVEKFVQASAYLAGRCPEVTKMKLAKLLYFADKAHLLDYGRPILGDRYIKMEFGPVPSTGYNLMKHDERVSPEDQALFNDYLEVKGNDIEMKANPNLAYLSESEVDVLDHVIDKYGKFTAGQLSKLAHREASWANAAMNGEMDYRLFFAGSTGTEGMEQLAQEDQELRDCLDELVYQDQRYGRR